ncbi:hypothetical protein EPI10_028166 [Gossypium australe]|uniref:Uncharacterized protein n=1 Tax=Gossypium australe TaxID=47621 RepID=A0A5B6UWI7_9ROSI|nr:hypothetical protein EPI10_028166 [Gossypium australe]
MVWDFNCLLVSILPCYVSMGHNQVHCRVRFLKLIIFLKEILLIRRKGQATFNQGSLIVGWGRSNNYGLSRSLAC